MKCIYLFGNFVVWIFGVVATKLCSSKCKYFLEFSISNECWSDWCSLFEWVPLFQSPDDVDNEGDNAIMLSLRLFFWKWLRLLLFSSLAAFAGISVELCMFGDAFAPRFGNTTTTLVDADATVAIDPSVTNNAIVVLVAHK